VPEGLLDEEQIARLPVDPDGKAVPQVMRPDPLPSTLRSLDTTPRPAIHEHSAGRFHSTDARLCQSPTNVT
jgi:hypothetical protein